MMISQEKTQAGYTRSDHRALWVAAWWLSVKPPSGPSGMRWVAAGFPCLQRDPFILPYCILSWAPKLEGGSGIPSPPGLQPPFNGSPQSWAIRGTWLAGVQEPGHGQKPPVPMLGPSLLPACPGLWW